MNLLKKETSQLNYIFQIILNEVHKKMLSADVKANIKQQEIIELMAVPYKFLYKNYLRNLKGNVKMTCIYFFNKFWLVFHPAWSVKNSRGGSF